MFAWTEKSELAARLVARGEFHGKIAQRCDCDRTTLARWKKSPEFQERVAQLLKELRERFRTEGYAVRENQILAKRRRLCAILNAARKRAGKTEFGGAQWDKSGFFIQRLKSLNAGDGQVDIVTEFELDTGMLRALTELEREISILTGDYKHRIEHSHEEPEPSELERAMSESLTTDEINELLAKLSRRTPESVDPQPDGLPGGNKEPEEPGGGPLP